MKSKNSFLVMLMCVAAMTTAKAQNYTIPVSETDEPMAAGTFTPDRESLRQYEVPDWFRLCQVRNLGSLGAAVC